MYANDGEADKPIDHHVLVKKVGPDLNKGAKPELNVPYRLDAKAYNLTIIAVPLQDSADTAFEFEYKVVGLKYDYWERFLMWLLTNENRGMFWIVLIGFLIGTMIFGALFSCCLFSETEPDNNRVAPLTDADETINKEDLSDIQSVDSYGEKN